MDKFLRNYQLLVEAGQRTFAQVAAGLPPGELVEIDPPFTLMFDVNRNSLSSANTSSFQIYNLSENVRKKIYKDKFATDIFKSVELKAGYGATIPTIFKGNVKQAYSVREGVNYVTSTEAYDGGFAFINGQTSAQFPTGTPQNEILDAVLKNLPGVNRGAVGDFSQKLQRGNTLSGNSADIISSLSGGAMFVDLEKAYILKDNECIEGSVLVIDSASGLLGTPRREETILTFDMIFEPRLLIGQRVQLRSATEKNFNGEYKVISLHHRGTVSGSIAGTAITSVGLWYGSQLLKVVNN